MSYEADAHQSQMSILRHLLLVPDAGFAELQKSAGLESDAANFHLKQLIAAGYLTKLTEGRYALSRNGKEYANRMDTDEKVIEKQPKLSVALIVQDAQGRFLAQERLKHPYFGFWGRPTGKIRWGEPIVEAAARELMEETGLTAALEMKGLYHKIDTVRGSGELLEDKYFCIVYGTQPQGSLIESAEGHNNAWLPNDEMMAKPRVFQSVPEITALAQGEHFGFMEHSYEYDPDEY
ncbi:NUDIX domain-containing protein [Candidatus Saccharibacteria bacterium]|nr:NUDIX domain-containing protein [Candidatus Saccharibacteria bacterium]